MVRANQRVGLPVWCKWMGDELGIRAKWSLEAESVPHVGSPVYTSRRHVKSPAGARLSFVCKWLIRVLLPLSVAILGATVHAIWSGPTQHNRYLDVVGTVMLGICGVSIFLWCIGAWTEGKFTEKAKPPGV